MNHDHTKLEPHIKNAMVAFNTKSFEKFTLSVTDCIKEMREHIHWELHSGYIKEFKAKFPELSTDISELNTDHNFLLNSLEEVRNLARKNDTQAFEIFEQFLKLRKKHIDHENEIYIDTHTIEIKN